MQSVDIPARQARAHYRHEMSTLTYVTLDAANGGIIRNLNHDGVAVQAVGALRPEQRVRLRFELRFPRLRVDASGEVSWAHSSGRCGIRFVELPKEVRRQIDEWIFSNLLDAVALDAAQPHSMFAASMVPIARGDRPGYEHVQEEMHGVSAPAAPLQAIPPDAGIAAMHDGLLHLDRAEDFADAAVEPYEKLNWLSRPLSGRTLSWVVDGLVVTAGVLLFTLIFLSIAKELPPWPLAVGTGFAAAGFVATAYWGLFRMFGGSSLGVRLALAAASVEEEEEEKAAADRFHYTHSA
jgi:hypothetical protein